MSWDADLLDESTGDLIQGWNYTHNTNVMIELVLNPEFNASRTVFEQVFAPENTPWWKRLDGMNAAGSSTFLTVILDGLRSSPDRFRSLNPSNGWGDYDRLVAKLEEMLSAIPEHHPVRWRVQG